MMAKKKVVALIEPAAGNVDKAFQKSVLIRHAEKEGLIIDLFVGERAPQTGSGKPGHRNLLNHIRAGEVDRILVVADVRHVLPDELLAESKKAGVKIDFIEVQGERGLT